MIAVLGVVLMPVALVTGLAMWESAGRKACIEALRPDPEISIDQFLDGAPPVRASYRVNSEAEDYLVVTVEYPPRNTLSVPSGPPAYVFNSKEDLVDWSSDLGDDGSFYERWTIDFQAPMIEGELLWYVEQLHGAVGVPPEHMR